MATPQQISVNDLQELRQWVATLTMNLPDRLVVLLRGEPAAGKTELVRSFVASLSSREDVPVVEVSSPTFALHHSYEVGPYFVDHWDLYRLESEDDLESSGFWDQFSAQRFLIFVEWPERMREDWIPQNLEIWQIEIRRENDQKNDQKNDSRRSVGLDVLQKEH